MQFYTGFLKIRLISQGITASIEFWAKGSQKSRYQTLKAFQCNEFCVLEIHRQQVTLRMIFVEEKLLYRLLQTAARTDEPVWRKVKNTKNIGFLRKMSVFHQTFSLF